VESGRESDVLGLAGRSQVGQVEGDQSAGERLDDFAGDSAFQQSHDLGVVAALGALGSHVGAGAGIARHPHQGDGVQRGLQ